MADRVHALTISYNGISHVLRSKAQIGVAFDPDKSPSPQLEEFTAIWDTGASHSVISGEVVKRCGLKPTGVAKVFTASGEDLCHTYLVSLSLPNGVGFPSIRVTEGKLNGGAVLIGMDIISRGDFTVSNYQKQTVFTFRLPSVERVDYVREVNEFNRKQAPKVGPNQPCPCGSGLKYKKCCGK